ncbi:hypothetical protein CSB45_00830, partial [candidate division KSB3 bacterium]
FILLQKGSLEKAKQDGRAEGLQEGIKKGREEGIKEGREEGREEGIKEGREEGREEGIKEGREEGIKEGIKEGITAEKIAIAHKSLQQGLDVPLIASITGLSLQDIDQLKKSER